MNKMKKLLSVVLAVVLAFSGLSVLGSAAIAQYKTVADLANDGEGAGLDAYSPYGQVTRLSTEERASMIQDALDALLGKANINMGTVIDVAGITVTLNFTSIDNACASIDSFKDAKGNFLFSIAAAFVNLGIIEELNLDTWNTGIDRAGDSQLTVFSEIFELLQANRTLIGDILRTGTLDLGIVGGMVGDLSAIEDLLGDLPGLIKGMLYGMLERWDDTTAEIEALEAAKVGDGGVEATLNKFVKDLFTNDMSISTVKLNSAGTITSAHTLPTTGTRVIYLQDGTTLTAKSYATQAYVDAKAKEGVTVNVGDYYISAKYVLEPEVGTSDYVWHQVNLDKDGNMKTLEDGTYDYVGGSTPNLKYYEEGSQLLPSLTATIDLENMSLADLLYTFIPPVFGDMAPVVLNGSVKKILAQFFGAKFNYVGQVGDDTVNALPDASDAFFTEEQGEYLWEWSNYAVINGNHYYRFEDQIFAADLSSINNYFSIINWDYEITTDFMNEFLPTANGGTASPTNTLLMKLNDFLIKVAYEVLVESATYTDNNDFTSNFERPVFTAGGNENLVDNIKALAQEIISLAPQHIFGSDYATNERCYYNLMMSNDDDTILTGIAAHLVNMIMPSMSLPSATEIEGSKAKVGAILAAVIREFAAYLAPEYNYDALIYTDFGTTTDDKVKTFVDPETAGLISDGQTASGYWLDVCLTMGMDVGYEYLRAFADLGEDSSEVVSGVVEQGYGAAGKTYEAGTTQAQLNAQWEALLDYIVDWALEKDYEWTWKMENLVNTDGLTIDLATAQDPWVKLDQILNSLLPADELLNITATDCETELEQLLRYDLILGIVDLRWEDLLAVLQVPNGFVRNTNVLDSLATVLKNLVNGIFAKIGGGSYALIPAAITDFDTLANQANLAQLVEDLLNALPTAYSNGLLDTVFPLLNMFLGWKTDVQKLADPVVWTTFRDGNDYAFQWSGNGVYPSIDSEQTKIHFLNNSSGMLEIHRDSSVVDHEYAIQITNVTSDATVNTLTFDYGDGYASPYEQIDIAVGGTYNGEEVVTVTITYEYLGKDGNGVGGTLNKNITFLISDKFEDAQVKTDAVTSSSTTREAYNKYVFSEDIYTAITSQSSAVSYKSTVGGNKEVQDYQAPAYYSKTEVSDPDGCDNTGDETYEYDYHPYPDYDQYAQGGYFTYNTQADSGWGTIETSALSTTGASSGKFFKAADGYDEDSDYPIGIYAFQTTLVTYNNVQNTFNYVFIHYDDYDIYELYTANKDRTVLASQVADVEVYNEWLAAWKDVVKYATYPMMTELNSNSDVDYLKVIMPAIPGVMDRFEAADEALAESIADANAAGGADSNLPEYVQNLLTQLQTDDKPLNGFEINFQDYEFYEYFNYADLRTEGRNLYASYLAPEVMDRYYILNSGIREAELNNVIAAETNETKAVAIEATKLENDASAIAESQAAHDNWQMPIHTKLYVDDLTARIAYYKQFLTGKEEPTSHLYFLNQEIAHVEAQELVEADYTEDSWASYATALAEAKKVAAGNDTYASFNSRIYDVKYNLMVAYKNLLLKDDSLIEAGGTADLLANIEIAEGILAMSLDEITLSQVAIDKGLTKEQALGHLLQGLGYYYVGEDGNTWNLYADSAYEYADNDRPNRQSNQAKVNACNNNLKACIEYFETAEAEPNTIMLKEDAIVEAFIDTTNNCGYTGIIYGIDTLASVSEDGALADNLTTVLGDEYLVITEAEGGETTGTVIEVLDADGETVLETYIFVYFGDVDKDGMITSTDGFFAEYFEANGEGLDEAYQVIAGDLDSDGMLTSTDGFFMEYFEANGEGIPTQQELGAMSFDIVYEI